MIDLYLDSIYSRRSLYRELDIAYHFEKILILLCNILDVTYSSLINNWFFKGEK